MKNCSRPEVENDKIVESATEAREAVTGQNVNRGGEKSAPRPSVSRPLN
jgi:hypothetical protein